MDDFLIDRSGSRCLDRALDLFQQLVREDGARPLDEVAAALGLPGSTAYRLVARFKERGLLVKTGKGLYRLGPALAARRDVNGLLAQLARPPLRRLARSTRRTAHLGVLEADMVTYLVKADGGRQKLLTREAMQLEAYCSAIGKVLLAYQEYDFVDEYLSSGILIALTERTITDPAALRRHLAEVRRQGYAVDDGEVADGLFCMAVPIRDRDGAVVAALSSSAQGKAGIGLPELIAALRDCAGEVERRAYGPPPSR